MTTPNPAPEASESAELVGAALLSILRGLFAPQPETAGR